LNSGALTHFQRVPSVVIPTVKIHLLPYLLDCSALSKHPTYIYRPVTRL